VSSEHNKSIKNRFQILLIDDNPADSHLFETALREVSARAILYWVATGEEALEYIAQQGRFQNAGEVDIIVLDLNLPGLSGFEVLTKLRQNAASRHKPVIVLSSSRAQSDIKQAYVMGANSYVLKAMSFETYLERVERLVKYWFDTVELPNQ
jgi:chemotaxis family two-component system response regulator Rcp1